MVASILLIDRDDVSQELVSAALGHGHLEATLSDDGAVYLATGPAPSPSDGWLEGVTPPIEVQVYFLLRIMLIHAEDIEPDYCVRVGEEVVLQRV